MQKLRGLKVDETIRSELDAAGRCQAGDSVIQRAKQARGTVGVYRRANGRGRCDICGPCYLHQEWGGARGDDKERDEPPLQMSARRGGNVGRRVHHPVQQDVWSPPEGV